MTSSSIALPDFVVMGGQYEVDGEITVILIASNSLSSVEIEEIARGLDEYFRYRPYALPPTYDIYLHAKMKDYVMCTGKSYPEAWQNLFNFWSPTGQRQEIADQKSLKDKYDWPEERKQIGI
jgi:hypothetical protein